jgi:hypothetical protein
MQCRAFVIDITWSAPGVRSGVRNPATAQSLLHLLGEGVGESSP